MRRVASIGAVALIAGGAAAGEIPAADSAPITTTIEGRTEPAEEIRVLGVRTGRLRTDPTAFGSTIQTSDFEAERNDLADLLAREVGVQIRRFGGPGERSEISIRGSTAAQVAVELDGVPLGSPLTGSTDLSQICVGLLDTIDVRRGGGAVGSGSGAIGGVVSMRSRPPSGTPVNRATVSGGAFGTWDATIHRSAKAGPLEYSAGYCGFTTDGDYSFARPVFQSDVVTEYPEPIIRRINNERVRHSGKLELGGALGERGHLRVRDYITYSSQGEPGLDSGNDVLGGQNPLAHGRNTHNVFSVETGAHDLGLLGSELTALFYHRYQRDDYRDPGVGEDPISLHAETRVHTLSGSLTDRWDGHLLGADHSLTVGFDAKGDSLEGSERSSVERANVGVMLQEEARLLGDRIVLVPGVRLDWTEGIGSIWLPSLGAIIEPLPWLRLRGGIERSYRVPGLDELYFPDKGFIRGNPELEPELAVNADAGVELELVALGPFSNLRLSAGFFQQDVENSIVWTTVSLYTIAPINTGPARIRGWELAASVSVTDYLRLSANHTDIDARSETTGRRLPGRADYETFFRAELGPSHIWKLMGELQDTGDIIVSESGNKTVPARSVWNVSASLNLAELPRLGIDRWLTRFWVFVQVNNVGDVAVRDALSFPQPGRNAHAGLELEW
jgi:outer membrane receptor protein involved in Fe transport